MSTEFAALPPALYRSEAFLEDLDLPPQPVAVRRAGQRTPLRKRAAAWLLAVPGTMAVLGSAAVFAGLPV